MYAAGHRSLLMMKELATHVHDADRSPQLRVIPNPTDGSTTITITSQMAVGAARIKIVDSWGRTWYSASTHEQTMTLSIAELSSGLYFIIVEASGYLTRQKLVVVK